MCNKLIKLDIYIIYTKRPEDSDVYLNHFLSQPAKTDMPNNTIFLPKKKKTI